MRTANTHQLKAGEVVVRHGSRFRLITRNERGSVVWFTTEYLGPSVKGGYEAIPKHQRGEWTIQGNERALWSVEEQQS